MPKGVRQPDPAPGERFFRLKFVGMTGRLDADGRRVAEFSCDCGADVVAPVGRVRQGKPKSCGCFRADETRKRGKSNLGLRRRLVPLGMRVDEHPDYWIWQGLRQRCNNPKAPDFGNYGGRGIRVCPAWENSFDSFRAGMGPRPSLSHSIDRINNDGDYEPGNCRWASMSEQANNKRTNTVLEHNGRRQNVSQWATETGINVTTILARLARGWPVEKTLTRPLRGA